MTDTAVPTSSPSAPTVVAGRAPAQGSDVADVVDGLRRTFRAGRTRPLSWRRAQLEALLRLTIDHETDLVDAIRADLGRPVAEAFGADIGHTRLHVRHLLKHFESWSRPRKVRPGMLSQPARAELVPEPLGVALVVAPWNYPVQLLLEPLAAALAAGNCVVAKPSELAPASAGVLARLLPRYLDPDAVAVVEGGVEETTALLEVPFDHIFFTGSTNVGKVMMAAAARHLTPVTLELGGKSPTLVAADADLEVAARRVAWGKFLNAGQTCIAPDYVLVERAARDRFVDLVAAAVDDFYGRDPRSSGDLGRIVNERHHDRLRGLLEGSGGTVVLGGDHDREARWFAPTVVLDPDPGSDLMAEEIFGPILPVVTVDSIDQGIEYVVDRPKPLALYVFSTNPATVDRVVSSTSSGGVCVNHTIVHVLPEDLPFGGVGASGMGSYHGQVGFDTFSHLKAVVRKPTRPDPRLLYPPYTSLKERVIRRAFR